MPKSTNHEIGPQSKSDKSELIKRMRFHQSWYRARKLKLCFGTGHTEKGNEPYGNMLTKEDGQKGKNFLSDSISELVSRRIKQGGVGDWYRLLHNMLGSQPMCFNLFGQAACDLTLAQELLSELWKIKARKVIAVSFEWPPKYKNKYTNDGTAFDAFIEYEASDGCLGFIGIETKLTEPFSYTSPKDLKDHKENEDYRKLVCNPKSPWEIKSLDTLVDRHNDQLWRNHLLMWSLLNHCDKRYKHGCLTVIYHQGDHKCERTLQKYKELLTDCDYNSSIHGIPLSTFVSAWSAKGGGELAQKFKSRYVELKDSEEEWEKHKRKNKGSTS